jgi:non-heme chloroperoxidase
MLAGAAGVLAASALSAAVLAAGSKAGATPLDPAQPTGIGSMPLITTKDGTQIFYKDWGRGQPIVFHHGWPLSADDWDAQMLFFLT